MFVDNARTADSLATILRTLRKVTSGRLICVYGARGDQDVDNRPLLGRVVERNADTGVITSNQPGTEPPLSIIHDVLDGYDRPSRGHVMPDRAKAICWAMSTARTGGTVLIAGDGVQSHQIGDEPFQIHDRDIARQWLKETATPPSLSLYE